MGKNKNAGFSLPELLIGMLIMLLIFGVIAGVLSTSLQSSHYNLAKANGLASGRNAVNQIEEIARYCSKINAPALDGTDGSLEIEAGDGTVYKVYIAKADGGQYAIYIDKNGASYKKMAEGMVKASGISFSRETSDPTTVLIDLTVNDTSYADSPDTHVKSRIKLLNLSS